MRRVYWNFYQAGAWKDWADRSPSTRQTLENLGDPLGLGRRLAHERGMEFYAAIKPYETGLSHAAPEGSPWSGGKPGLPGIGGTYTVDPWVLARPELRVRAPTSDLPSGLDGVPIQRIQLRQKDMSPVRIQQEDLEVWTSPDNNGYRRQDITFTLSESVARCPRDVVDMDGNPLTRKGESVRTLDLSGLSLLDPFIAVTTSFTDDCGSFPQYRPGDGTGLRSR